VRQQSVKLLSFAKQLRSCLEVASEFESVIPQQELIQILEQSNHFLLVASSGVDLVEGMLVFCPSQLARHDHVEQIVLDLLTCSIGVNR